MDSTLDAHFAHRRQFGRQLALLRRGIGLSQTQLAHAAGLTAQRLSRLERGAALVLPADLSTLAKAFAAGLDRLLDGNVPAPVRLAPPTVRSRSRAAEPIPEAARPSETKNAPSCAEQDGAHTQFEETHPNHADPTTAPESTATPLL